MSTQTKAIKIGADQVSIAPRFDQQPGIQSTLAYLYFMRFSILLWLAPSLLVILDSYGGGLVRSITHGLLVLENIWQYFSSGALAFLVCAAALTSARIVCAYGGERFNVGPPRWWKVGPQMSWRVVIASQLPALPLLIYLISHHGKTVTAIAGALGVAAGCGAGFALLFFVAYLYNLFHEPEEKRPYHAVLLPVRGRVLRKALNTSPPAYGWSFRRLKKKLGAGYSGPDNQLHSGHKMATWLFLFLLLLYVVLGIATAPGASQSPGECFPVLASLLFILLLWGWILAGVAFFADRYRIPVILLVVLWGSFSTDHFYRVKPHDPGPQWITPAAALENWERKHANDNAPIVVITAQGGGIQASAWTARVLAELEKLVPQENGGFHSSVLLLSAVSGGSVAAMDYANQYLLGPNGFSEQQLDCMAIRSKSSSLEAVGWGLLYPDLLRIVSGQAWKLGPFIDSDRGASLQKRWLQIRSHAVEQCPALYADPPTISDWHMQLSSGQMPAVALNATTVESGQRFLLSNFVFQQDSRHALTFHESCPQCDLDVMTAARLSASFTYVSPVSRAHHGDGPVSPPSFHVADGGYFDNYGVVTAIEWLASATFPDGHSDSVNRKGHPLLLIEIHCCEDQGNDCAMGHEERPSLKEPPLALSQLTAPLTTLLNVRSAGQEEHNCNLVRLFQLATKGVFELHHVVIPFSQKSKPSDEDPEITETIQVPLSWHLTEHQKENIEKQWKSLMAHPECTLNRILKAFGTNAQAQSKFPIHQRGLLEQRKCDRSQDRDVVGH